MRHRTRGWLHKMNSLLVSSLEGTQGTLSIQYGKLLKTARGGGVSSFGYSGTIAHAVLTREDSKANYSAANHSLDMLVVCRRSTGHTAVCTQWGAWAEIGMAAANELVAERMKASGIGLIGLA